MAKNPLIKYFNHIPDQCSITRAARAFGIEIEDILNWAEGYAIKLYVDLQTPVPIIGDGTEVDDYLRFFSNSENSKELDSLELKQELQAIQESLSIIDIAHNPESYYKNYQIEGRWNVPPFFLSTYRYSDEVEIDELHADFSMMCGVELSQPLLIKIAQLNIITEDLIKIADSLNKQEQMPSIYNGQVTLNHKPRRQRIDRAQVIFIDQLLHLIPELDGITSRPKQYAIIQLKLSELGIGIAVEEVTYKRWGTWLKEPE